MTEFKQDLTIQNAITASAKAIFGDDVEYSSHPRQNSVTVHYQEYRLNFNAFELEKAKDPERLVVPFNLGAPRKVGLTVVSMPLAKQVIDLIEGVSTKWYVVRELGGKFADGYFGWDGHVHSEEQIFEEENIPYKKDSLGMEFIHVGTGVKPSVYQVNTQLEKG